MNQNKNWAPTIRGVCFCPSSYVVRRGDRFFPGTMCQDRHRRLQAAGEPEKRCSPEQYKQIDLEHFLKDYDLNIEDLMGR